MHPILFIWSSKCPKSVPKNWRTELRQASWCRPRSSDLPENRTKLWPASASRAATQVSSPTMLSPAPRKARSCALRSTAVSDISSDRHRLGSAFERAMQPLYRSGPAVLLRSERESGRHGVCQTRHTCNSWASTSHSIAARCAPRSSRAAMSRVASCPEAGSELLAGNSQREMSGSIGSGSDGGR